MTESQAQTRQRPGAIEPCEPVNRLGEPGIADRKISGAVPWECDHPINLRLSIPLFFKRYYVTILAGPERRSTRRLKEERRKHPLATKPNIITLTVLGTIAGLAILAVIQVVSFQLLQQVGVVDIPQ